MTGVGTAGSFTPDFCKHIKYCCLHQNANSARIDNESIDRTLRNRDGRTNIGTHFKLNELNTNIYNNFSDDEKSMKFNKKFPADASNHANSSSVHIQSFQQNYDSFENRKCNCGKLLRK